MEFAFFLSDIGAGRERKPNIPTSIFRYTSRAGNAPCRDAAVTTELEGDASKSSLSKGR
jgi:hypothetical protein